MTSEARVAANRRNAEKSTGPRTPEGKAVVAQNAIKHGLLARQALIKDEDPVEFEVHRRQMLDELAPEGAVEVTLAERAVSLSWRLKRAEHMQDEALDYLIEADAGDSWMQHLRSKGDPSAGADLTFGRVVARDFAEKKTLDRLMMYERRIENSLYRTMNELKKLQESVSSLKCEVSSGDSALQTSDSELDTPKETPCGVTTNGPDSAKQSQLPDGTACETKPIALVVRPAGTGNEAEALAGAGRYT